MSLENNVTITTFTTFLVAIVLICCFIVLPNLTAANLESSQTFPERVLYLNHIGNSIRHHNDASNQANLQNQEKMIFHASVKVRSNPVGITVDNSTDLIYINHRFSNIISVINGTTDKVMSKPLTLNSSASAVFDDPNSTRLYAYMPAYDGGRVAIIDKENNEVIANIKVGNKSVTAFPNSAAFALDATKGRLYIAGPSSDGVSYINTDSLQLEGTVKVGKNYNPQSLAAYSKWIYVANRNSNNISIIDTTQVGSGSGLKTVNQTLIPKSASNVTGDRGIIFNPRNKQLYIANVPSRSVYIIDITNVSRKNVAIVDLKNKGIPSTLTVDPKNGNVFVTYFPHNNFITIIDPRPPFKQTQILAGKDPSSIAVITKSHMIYIVNSASDSVSVITEMPPYNLVAGITFRISPANSSGIITCNNRNFADGDYSRFSVSTPVSCFATDKSPSRDYVFAKWQNPEAKAPVNEGPQNFGSSGIIHYLLKTLQPYLTTVNACYYFIPALPYNNLILHVPTYENLGADFLKTSLLKNACAINIGLILLVLFVLFTIGISFFLDRFARHRVVLLRRLTPTEIMTIDSTVIVGVLILLSLQGNRPQLIELTAGIVFPFAISVITVLGKLYNLGKRLIITGFVNLMIAVIILIFTSLT